MGIGNVTGLGFTSRGRGLTFHLGFRVCGFRLRGIVNSLPKGREGSEYNCHDPKWGLTPRNLGLGYCKGPSIEE